MQTRMKLLIKSNNTVLESLLYCRWIDMSHHSYTFRVNQSLQFLLNAAHLKENKTNTSFIVFCWPDWGPNLRSQNEHANHYAIDVLRADFGNPAFVLWVI